MNYFLSLYATRTNLFAVILLSIMLVIFNIHNHSLFAEKQFLKNNSNTLEDSSIAAKKSKAKEIFIQNAERDVQINWKHFMLSNVENSLPSP